MVELCTDCDSLCGQDLDATSPPCKPQGVPRDRGKEPGFIVSRVSHKRSSRKSYCEDIAHF